MSDLSRDPDKANNSLDKIFDKEKILEKQEAAALFGEIGFHLAGDLAEKMDWKEGSPEKILLHGLIGGLMAEINGGSFGEGLTTAAINEMIIGLLDKHKKDLGLDAADTRWLSALIGGAISEGMDGSFGQGAGIADSATKNNYWLHQDQQQAMLEELEQCDNDPQCNRDKILDYYARKSIQNMENGLAGSSDYIYVPELKENVEEIKRQERADRINQGIYDFSSEYGLKLASSDIAAAVSQFDIASTFLQHGFYGNGAPLYFSDDSRAANLLKENDSFLQTVDEMYRNDYDNSTGEFVNPGLLSSVGDFNGKAKEADAFLSIGKYNIKLLDETRNADGSITIKALVTDTYDYTEYRGTQTLGDRLNDIGTNLSQKGKIKPFDVSIEVNVTIWP